MNRSDAHAKYLVDLCAAAVHHAPLPRAEFEVDPAYLVRLIAAHHLSGLLYPLVKDATDLLDESALESLRRDFRTDQLRDASQEDALEEIAEAFGEKQIRFLVMKGIVQKRFYEKSYHRMMGDLDLLIFEEDRAKVREIMEELGYETQSYEELYDDVYYRRPFLNVEIHVALGKERDFSDPRFLTVWDRAEKSAFVEGAYELSLMDYYLYFIHHAAKHCKGHGTGIRTVIDLWYLREGLLPKLDRGELDEALTALNSLTFEREFLKLCSVWLDGEAGDDFQNEGMRRFLILEAGLYGNASNSLFHTAITDADLSQSHANKRGMFLKRIFLPRKNMSIKYPILKKYAWLLPFCWIHRIFKTIFSPGKVRGEAKLYSKVTRGMDLQSEMRARFGFTESSGSDSNGAE